VATLQASNDIRLLAVDFALLSLEEWEEATRWLMPAIDRGNEVTLQHVESDLLCDLAQLWLAIDGEGDMRAACVTQRTGDNLHFWLCGGRGCDWRDLCARVQLRARFDGIKTFSCEGRNGWRRLLKGLTHG
jgi:hypothetical protein